MTLAEVIHHLVDNSQAFDTAGAVDAHKAVSEHFIETERHPMVPSPQEEQTQTDEKNQKIADLKAQLAVLEPEPEPEPEPEQVVST
jgi:hypothetical protein